MLQGEKMTMQGKPVVSVAGIQRALFVSEITSLLAAFAFAYLLTHLGTVIIPGRNEKVREHSSVELCGPHVVISPAMLWSSYTVIIPGRNEKGELIFDTPGGVPWIWLIEFCCLVPPIMTTILGDSVLSANIALLR